MAFRSKSRKQKSEKQKAEAFATFRCKRCGACCTGDGYVNVTEEECRAIAEYLGMPAEKFLEQYTIEEPGFLRYLVDGSGEDAPCVFLELDGKGLASCRIESVKPQQCRDFPMKWRIPNMNQWCKALLEG